MTVRIINSNPYGNLSKERLDEFEKIHAVTLPDDYKKFLLEYNGGKPLPSFFWIKPQEDGSNVFQIYGLHDGPKPYSIDKLFEEKLGIPVSLMLIGDDGTDNFICMDISLERKGGIFFIDHETHPFDDANSYIGITKITNSFSDFLLSLSENPE